MTSQATPIGPSSDRGQTNHTFYSTASGNSEEFVFTSLMQEIWYLMPKDGITSMRMARIVKSIEGTYAEKKILVSQAMSKMWYGKRLSRTSPNPNKIGHHSYTYYRNTGAVPPNFAQYKEQGVYQPAATSRGKSRSTPLQAKEGKAAFTSKFTETAEAPTTAAHPNIAKTDVTIDIGGTALSVNEAKEVYTELKYLFG